MEGMLLLVMFYSLHLDAMFDSHVTSENPDINNFTGVARPILVFWAL